jgi:hypothetical protein
MDIREWFCPQDKSGIAAFAEAQILLYRHDASLQDYFLPLQHCFRGNSSTKAPPLSITHRIADFSFKAGYKIARPAFARRKFKVDVLFCPMPYFQRAAENRLLIQMIMGLTKTGASILCLLPDDAPCRGEIEFWLENEGHSDQVTLMDPTAILNPLASHFLPRVARCRGRAVFDEIVQVLQPHDLAPSLNSRSAFDHAAYFVEAWRNLEPWIEFDAVVTRCHWQMLCSSVCRTASQRKKPAITFQQGVIGHTLDVPVPSSKYVAFGDSSARLLARMNRSFFEAVGNTEPEVEFVPGGCLFDTILSLPNQFSKYTLLIIDENVSMDDFYGIGTQREAIIRLAEKLLASSVPPKLIIRPHPHWDSLGLEAWKDIIREYPNNCELSHAAWTLEDDLKRSSVVIGVFSGALTLASASGLPTFFVVTASGYATEDLACFRSGQTYPPDEAFHEISRVLTEPQVFAEARAVSLRNARDYYKNGANLDLGAPFFERMLRKKPPLPSSQGTTRR